MSHDFASKVIRTRHKDFFEQKQQKESRTRKKNSVGGEGRLSSWLHANDLYVENNGNEKERKKQTLA
mgnify:CR=1 FL=1